MEYQSRRRTMMIQAFAFATLLSASVNPSNAFLGMCDIKRPFSASATVVKGTMDAYEAQMRAMAPDTPVMSGLSASAAAVAPNSRTSYNTIAPNNFKLSQRWRKKTKQLATLGPASSSSDMIEKLFLAGADV
jgi:hypothetical protein